MPFIQRIVQPVYLSRRNTSAEDRENLLTDYELETVTNNTLSNALRQLASLVLIANDIFDDLTKQLDDVRERSTKLRTRIELVEEKVEAFDPKTVTVPESDICSFAQRSVHFAASHAEGAAAALFGAETRPTAVRRLYAAAAPTPVPVMRLLDRYRRDGSRSSRFFTCTPVLVGARRRRMRTRPELADIETSTPAAIAELRRWTSAEALGDITVAPDCSSVVRSTGVWPGAEPGAGTESGAEEVDAETSSTTDHRLPSPEEQAAAVALRFPGEVVTVDVSGRAFRRMSLLRRSLLDSSATSGAARAGLAGTGGGSGRRKPRSRRRNTIAGTDRKELRRAVTGESRDENEILEQRMTVSALDDLAVTSSTSSDPLKTKDESPPDNKKSHFNSLKQWGKVKLKLIKSVASSDTSNKTPASPEEVNIYETVTAKGKKADLKHERKASGSNLPISTQSAAMNMAVKLRQRQTRTGKDDALHSSSGNWSASSESGRASIGSENTSTTHQPKSTTTLSSAATSSNSLNHHQPSSSASSRRKFVNTSASSSVSEGTLTPDIISDFAVPFVDDGETSSIYSCDTEGYYTSFHLDSGLKTLKEEDSNSSPQTPLHSSSALSSSPGHGSNTLTAENEYELFGKGSTSTTTSSAGTVCTTLMVGNNESNLSLARGPTVPERKSSLDRKSNSSGSSSQMVMAVVHKQNNCEMSESPDSGHNTSSSPVDSTSSPHGTLTGRSSEYEFSESDLEGVDRLERIRVKTTINSSRIPSMCVITPPPSDDETSLNHYVPSYKPKASVPSQHNDKNNLLETDFGVKIVHKQVIVNSQQNNIKHEELPHSNKIENQGNIGPAESSEKETKVVGNHESNQTKIHGNTVTSNKKEPKPLDVLNCDMGKVGQQKTSLLPPLNNMLDKVKGVLSSANIRKSPTVKDSGSALVIEEDKPCVDSGDYVTIADVRNNRTSLPSSPVYSNDIKPVGTAMSPSCDIEYVSLNELPVSKSAPSANLLISPSNSLERKRRQGARVTLDSEGKVVYSSDSLRRNKASHTTFEPGPYVKESSTPSASPLPSHRLPKTNIRPVTLSNPGRNMQHIFSSKPPSPAPGYKQSMSPTRSKATSPTSPVLGKVIIRAGNKSNSASHVVSPTPPVASVIAPSGRPMSPQPTRGAYVNMQSPDNPPCINPGITTAASNTDDDEEGKSSNLQPPVYVSPPPVRDVMSKPKSPACFTSQEQLGTYWTLPNRRYHNGGESSYTYSVQDNQPFQSRFNTITHTNRDKNVRDPYITHTPYGAHFSSQHSSSQAPKQHVLKDVHLLKQNRHPTPASIPIVPSNDFKYTNQNSDFGLHTSTPTKEDKRNLCMNMSMPLSPIQKYSNHKDTFKDDNYTSHKQAMKLLQQPKSSMTAEELFAAIHKSKRKLNIKTDSDGYSRSASPSCSSMNSLSPGSSESSINGIRCGTPKNDDIPLYMENGSRNRHSWSPNEADCIPNTQMPFVTSPGNRQSWACDRLGPANQTSRNDFKRLLLQHGSKMTNGIGSTAGRLSAVEQLRLSRQHKNLSPTSSSATYGYLPRSPAEKRLNGPKLLPSPRSAATWRFASPRTDILSSTILEDCAEEEKANCSPQEARQNEKLSMNTNHGNISYNFETFSLKSPNFTEKESVNDSLRRDNGRNIDFIGTSNVLSQTSPKAKGQMFSTSSFKTRILETRPPVSNVHTNTHLPDRINSSEPLSPSNVKENMDSNHQNYTSYTTSPGKLSLGSPLTNSQLSNLRARQLFMQNSNTVNNHQPNNPQQSSPIIAANYYNSRGSPARSILGTIDRASPSKATLETAL